MGRIIASGDASIRGLLGRCFNARGTCWFYDHDVVLRDAESDGWRWGFARLELAVDLGYPADGNLEMLFPTCHACGVPI